MKKKQKQPAPLLEEVQALDETGLNEVTGGSGTPTQSDPPTIKITSKAGASPAKVQDAIGAIETTIAKSGKSAEATIEKGYTHIKFRPPLK